jgi:outer membrane biosynthesis protein TonB
MLVRIAWMSVLLLPVLVILGELFFGTNAGSAPGGSEAQRKAGLAIVRITWIAAILVPVLIILGVVLAGSDGGDSSGGVEGQQAQRTTTAAQPGAHGQRAKEQAPRHNRSASGIPRLAAQPEKAGGRAPAVTPGPEPAPAPEPKPKPAPQPKPPRTPPETTVPSPPVSESPPAPVQTTITISNNNGPGGT